VTGTTARRGFHLVMRYQIWRETPKARSFEAPIPLAERVIQVVLTVSSLAVEPHLEAISAAGQCITTVVRWVGLTLVALTTHLSCVVSAVKNKVASRLK
jgi:hypothetical protein